MEYQIQMKDGSESTIQFANMLPPPHQVAEIREPYCLPAAQGIATKKPFDTCFG